MTSYAEHLGIDLVKLEAERHYHYGVTRDVPRDVTRDITAPPESSDDWQPITRAANTIRYNVESVRRLAKADKIRSEKRNGRTWVYYPDLERHAGKR